MIYVKTYSEVGASDMPLVGSKAWVLARLSRQSKDVRVPKGFCITSELIRSLMHQERRLKRAYDTFVNDAELSGVVRRRLAKELEAKIRDVDVGAETASELASALKENVSDDSNEIIVRSSANIEDLTSTSFAGQFKSIVARRDLSELIRTIKACWSVVTSESLVAYAFARRVPLSRMSLAFLVQEFIAFDYAGVLFTRIPIPGVGSAGDFMIEYAMGGAEQVVSGRGAPFRCILKSATATVESAGGNTGSGGLRREVLLRLGVIAKDIEGILGGDQDIEWGVKGEDIYVLQSRPITV